MPPDLALPLGAAVATDPEVVVSSTSSFLAFFSGRPFSLVFAKSSASLGFMVLATFLSSGLAPFTFSPFCIACAMPMNLRCFLLTARSPMVMPSSPVSSSASRSCCVCIYSLAAMIIPLA